MDYWARMWENYLIFREDIEEWIWSKFLHAILWKTLEERNRRIIKEKKEWKYSKKFYS